MKSTLIRIFTIMTLTTSMFAMSDKAKDSATTDANPTKSKETTVSSPANQSDSGDSKAQQIEQQNQEWLHNLQGIYGG